MGDLTTVPPIATVLEAYGTPPAFNSLFPWNISNLSYPAYAATVATGKSLEGIGTLSKIGMVPG